MSHQRYWLKVKNTIAQWQRLGTEKCAHRQYRPERATFLFLMGTTILPFQGETYVLSIFQPKALPLGYPVFGFQPIPQITAFFPQIRALFKEKFI
jgi:hypothetical protein